MTKPKKVQPGIPIPLLDELKKHNPLLEGAGADFYDQVYLAWQRATPRDRARLNFRFLDTIAALGYQLDGTREVPPAAGASKSGAEPVTFGEWVRNAREELGLTRTQLRNRMLHQYQTAPTVSAIRDLENGARQKPTPSNRTKYEWALQQPKRNIGSSVTKRK